MKLCPHNRQRNHCKQGKCLNYEKWARHLISVAKARAKKYEYPCDLTFEKDGNYIIQGLKIGCPIFKTPFRRKAGCGTDSATIERFQPNRGYVTGNIFIISLKANLIKNGTLSWKEIQAVADWVRKTELQLSTC